MERPIIDYAQNPLDPSGVELPVYGNPVAVQGFRLLDARASYGIGLQTFALGFPVHFDWSWRTLFNKGWEDVKFALRRRQRGVPQAEVHDVDRLRLLKRGWGLGAARRARRSR